MHNRGGSSGTATVSAKRTPIALMSVTENRPKIPVLLALGVRRRFAA